MPNALLVAGFQAATDMMWFAGLRTAEVDIELIPAQEVLADREFSGNERPRGS